MSDIPENSEPSKLLVEAVRRGDKECVEAALASGANPHICLPDGDEVVSGASLLTLAAFCGHAHLVPVLLNAGLHVDYCGKFPYTALQVAVHVGQDRVVDALMKANPDVNAKDPEGVSTLHLAARKEREYCAKVLIEAGADLNARDKNMRTPLHVSVFGTSTKIMQILLKAGCDAKAVNDKGFSVLHIAALSGNIKAVQELRMAGLEADGQDTMGLTPEEVADTWGSHGTAWLLRKMPKISRTFKPIANSSMIHTMLHRSWEEYETEGRKTISWIKDDKSYLLEANTPINRDPHYQDEVGFTPLHWAAQLGLTSTTRALLKHCCCHPRVFNYAGNTPAQLAEAGGYTLLAQELSQFTVEGTPKDSFSPVELYWKLLINISATDDMVETVKLLILGAPLQATQDLHTDALVLAITCNKPRIVTLLAAAGAPLTTISGGLSLLQVAWLTPDVTTRVRVLITRIFLNVLQVERNRVGSEDLALRNGINHLLNCLQGESPWRTNWPYRDQTFSDLTDLLVAAARNNCPLTATFLKLCGGMCFKQDEQGTTPLHAALEARHTDMARVMVRDLGACPYIADSQGNLPIDLLQEDVKEQLEEEIYQYERRQLENYQEKAKDQKDKSTFHDVLEVLDFLFAKHVGLNADIPSKILLTQALLVGSRRGMHLLTFLVLRVGGLPINAVVDPTHDSTALHQAASHGHSVCVALLLSLGACVLMPDRYGHTAAHLAAMFCHRLTYRLLIKHMNGHNPLNRAGKSHQHVARSFKTYMKLYDKMKVVDPQRTLRFNDSSEATKDLLTECNISNKIENVKKTVVDFTQGEAREVKEIVMKEVSALVADVAAQDSLYDGRLVLVGSSADGSKLYAPDEFDVNLVMSKIQDVKVTVEELVRHEALLKGHTLKACVRTDHPGLQGSAFKINLYQLMKNCLVRHLACDKRLSYVPPGLERTQAGVTLNLAWQGETYPLLLINVDVVPVLAVPWPNRLKRPPLTPDSLLEVFLTNTADDEWRFSLAAAEADVLGSLNWEERAIYASCKLVLSYLKVERWMPKTIKDSYCWWDSRKWRITAPAGFGVKNSFLRQLELKRKGKLEWPGNRLTAVAAVLRGMCEDFKDPTNGQECLVPMKVHAYFGGEFEKPKLGEGAPAIIEVLENDGRTKG